MEPFGDRTEEVKTVSAEKNYLLRIQIAVKSASKEAIRNFLISKLVDEKKKGNITWASWNIVEETPPFSESGEI